MSRFLLILAASVAFTVACSSWTRQRIDTQVGPAAWPMYQYRANHNAVFSGRHLHVSWSTLLGDRINAGLAVVNGLVYTDSFDHRVYALDATSGRIVWSAPTSNIVMSTPVLSEGVVLVGTGHNGFLRPTDASSLVWGRPEGDDVEAYDAETGVNRWSFHTIGEDMPSMALSRGIAVFANGDLHAYGLHPGDGTLMWSRRLPGIASMASTTIDGDLAFTSLCRNAPRRCYTVALHVPDGKITWVSNEGGSDASPTVDNGIVFVAGSYVASKRYQPGGRDIVAALDEQSGRTLWRFVAADGPFTMLSSDEHEIAGAAHDGTFFTAINSADEIVAFDEKRGSIRWKLRTAAPVKMSPIVSKGHLYFGDVAGLIYNVQESNGKIITTSAMRGSFSTSPFVIVGETIFCANSNRVVALPISDLEPGT